MPITLRFSKSEEKELNDKCIELNKKLIAKNKMPIRQSELAHFIFENCIKNVHVDKDGNLNLEI